MLFILSTPNFALQYYNVLTCLVISCNTFWLHNHSHGYACKSQILYMPVLHVYTWCAFILWLICKHFLVHTLTYKYSFTLFRLNVCIIWLSSYVKSNFHKVQALHIFIVKVPKRNVNGKVIDVVCIHLFNLELNSSPLLQQMIILMNQ